MRAGIRVKQGTRSYRADGSASSACCRTERLERLKVEADLALSWKRQFLARLMART
jgi:hypothetical protein